MVRSDFNPRLCVQYHHDIISYLRHSISTRNSLCENIIQNVIVCLPSPPKIDILVVTTLTIHRDHYDKESISEKMFLVYLIITCSFDNTNFFLTQSLFDCYESYCHVFSTLSSDMGLLIDNCILSTSLIV